MTDDKPKFERHKIPEDTNPAHELLSLYQEADTIDNVIENEPLTDNSFIKIIDHDRQKHRRFILWASIIGLMILATASVAGFIFFGLARTAATDKINLTIEAPENVKINQSFSYLIKYENLGVGLSEAKMELQLPNGFIVESSDPVIINKQWAIGKIAKYGIGKLILTGRIINETDQAGKLIATMSYYPDNFNSQFSKTIENLVRLETPNIDLVADFPAGVGAGADFPINIDLRNNEVIGFTDVKLALVYPANFQFASSATKPSEGNNAWKINNLPASQKISATSVIGRFPIGLTFNSDDERQQNFSAQFWATDANKQYHLIKQEYFSIKIINQKQGLYLTVNNRIGQQNFSLGDKLNFAINLGNNGDQTIKNSQVKLFIDNSQPLSVLDWSKMDDKNNGVVSSTENGRVITWNKSQIPKLASLAPGDKLTIAFSLPSKPLSQFNKSDQTALAKSIITVKSQLLSGGVTIESNTVALGIESGATVK